MLLGRLRLRGRLALLVLVPLLATVALTVALAFEVGQHAARADETASAVRLASRVSVLIRALQQERLVSVGFIHDDQASRVDVLLAHAVTADAEQGARGGSATVDTAINNLSRLDPIRRAVLGGVAPPEQVIGAYTSLIIPLIESLRLLEYVDGSTDQGREVIAVDAELHSNEGFATMLASLAASDLPEVRSVYIAGVVALEPAVLRFYTYATPSEAALLRQSADPIDARLGSGFANAMIVSPGSTVAALDHRYPFEGLVSLTGLGRFIESKVLNDALTTSTRVARNETLHAIGFVSVSIVAVLIAIALGFAVARSVSGPVLRLTRSAEGVARLAEAELVRVADDDTLAGDPVRLRPIEASGRDELADFARAFGRVQATAAQLVERQVVSRRNVAQMFGHVGRRTQNLVGRQISLIDKLESQETDAERLADLYRLDHISSRLRRSASSLVVLSGNSGPDEFVAPVPLDEVVRLGLAEIEDYQRVQVDVTDQVHVVPGVVNDLVLLLAELMENATGFSPPGNTVMVTAEVGLARTTVRIVDHGLGMPPERFIEENARLTRRERLDLTPTRELGLFVVGRIARRHGLAVTLIPTAATGVTVTVEIPARLLTSSGGAIPPSRTARARAMVPIAAQPELEMDVRLIDRANQTLRSGRPWNAFELTDLPLELTAAPHSPSPVDSSAEPLVAERPAPPAWPPTPAYAAAAEPGPMVSTLSRRVPGASLDEMDRTRPRPTIRLAQPTAEEARDSVAQLESGIARAMREVESGDAQ